MICSVSTMGINGISGSFVRAECYVSNGLPGFDIVGLPDAAVKEARERVRAAAKNSGLTFPTSRITVNLAPANLKKTGTHFDLPILIGIMSACGNVKRPNSSCAFLGELSLDGSVNPVNGVLPIVYEAKKQGFRYCMIPMGNYRETTAIDDIGILPVKNLYDVIRFVARPGEIATKLRVELENEVGK